MTELYVATGDAIAHITQQGEEWYTRITLKDSGVQCLALDPHHPGTLYAGSHGKGVFKSVAKQPAQHVRIAFDGVVCLLQFGSDLISRIACLQGFQLIF